MARSKLDEHKLDVECLTDVDRGEVLESGPFTVEMIHMTHSIPDAMRRRSRPPTRHGADHGRLQVRPDPVDGTPADIARLATLGDEGVLLLCGDSTNADRRGSRRRRASSGRALMKVFAAAEGRLIVTSFASNIHRVQQVIDAADALGRQVALVGRSMRKNVKIGLKARPHRDSRRNARRAA